MVLVEDCGPTVFEEEVGSKNRSHQIIIGGDVGPHGWLNLIESRIDYLGGEKWSEVLRSVFHISR